MTRRPRSHLYGYMGPFRLSDIEPGVRGLISSLNKAGYRTWSSEEGGLRHESPYSWISLSETSKLMPEEILEIRDIIKSSTDVPFRIFGPKGIKPPYYYFIQFDKPLREEEVPKELWGKYDLQLPDVDDEEL